MPRRKRSKPSPPLRSRGRRGPMAAGLLLTVIALFMVPMSFRETCTAWHRAAYAREVLELERFHEGRGRNNPTRLEGHIVSSGEPVVTDQTGMVGLDRLRQLDREGRVAGFRLPIRYLSVGGFWKVLDRLCPFRIHSEEEFEMGFPTGLVAANAIFAVVSVLLIRRGTQYPPG